MLSIPILLFVLIFNQENLLVQNVLRVWLWYSAQRFTNTAVLQLGASG